MAIFGKINFHSSIRIKLMSIVSAIVLLSLGLLTYITLNIFAEDMTNILIDMNARTNKLLSERIDSELRKFQEELQRFARLAVNPQTKPLLAEMLANKSWSHIALVQKSAQMNHWQTAHSTTFLHSFNNSKAKTLFANKIPSVIQYGLKKIPESLSSGFYLENISPQFQQPAWLMIVPILDKTNKSIVRQVVLALIHASTMTDALMVGGKHKKSQSLYTSFLIDRQGKTLIHSDKQKMLNAFVEKDHPVVKKLFEAKTKTGLIRYAIDDKEYFGAYASLDLGHLGLITSIEASKALEGVAIARVRALLISLLIISTAILFIYFFSKTISEPIKELVHGTKEIVKGHFGRSIVKKTNDEIGDLTDAFNSMSHGLEEREKLKGALGKFVNPEIAEKVLNGDLALGGERKEATVFFSDIRSFTSISEKLEPEEVVEFLNQYMTLMVDIIHKSGGVVDKFIGDAIMALWGLPVSKGNDVVHCIDAALAMRIALIGFNKERSELNKPLIHIGCGINAGPVVAGQIGSEDRLEYTVIGDTVNLASRVESLNKSFGTDILISEKCYTKVKDIYHCVAMDKIIVKGKAKEQQVYAVLGQKADVNTPKNLTELRKMVGHGEPVSEKKKTMKK